MLNGRTAVALGAVAVLGIGTAASIWPKQSTRTLFVLWPHSTTTARP